MKTWASHAGLAPETLLRMLGVPEAPRSFVLTPYERPNNVMGQQVRALNLVFSLLACKVVRPGQRIGIIGAGAAGVTAAAYAVSQGCPVTILEKEEQALSLFSASNRPLYPRLFDWPDHGWDQEHAELPVMSWKSQPARSVAESLRLQWEGWLATYAFKNSDGIPFLEFVPNAKPLDIRSDPDSLVWRRDPEVASRKVAAILLMIGLGVERRPSGLSWTEYWQTNEPALNRKNGSLFIWGNGDGAIQDLLNVVVDGFSYSKLVRPEYKLSELASSARDIEGEAHFVPQAQRSEFISIKYSELAKRLPQLPVRRGITRAVITGRSRGALDENSYALNRLLLAKLINQGGIEYRTGEYECREVDGKYHVVGPGRSVERYDHAVVRHGLSFTLDAQFPDLANRLSPAMRTWGELRLTRRPMWPAPVALALAQTSTDHPRERPRPAYALYADFLDPLVQRRTLDALAGNRTRLTNLYRGRLRILSLFARHVVVNSQSFIDGVFFQSLSKRELLELADECKLEFIRRSLIEFLRFGTPSNSASWADSWLAEPWGRTPKTAKPYLFHSLLASRARSLFKKLEKLNVARKPCSPEYLLAELERHGGTSIIEAARTLERLVASDDGERAWSTRRPRNLGARFLIQELFDPGWLWQELEVSEREFVAKYGQQIIPARRPRQAFAAASWDLSVRSESGTPTRLESWLYHSYHRTIAVEEGADAWETVWTGACEWSRWGLAQQPTVERAKGFSFEQAGAIHHQEWMGIRRALQVQVDDWYLGRRDFSSVLTHGALIRNKSLTASSSSVSAWCTGDFEWHLRQVPARSHQGTGVTPFVIYERHRNKSVCSIIQLGS